MSVRKTAPWLFILCLLMLAGCAGSGKSAAENKMDALLRQRLAASTTEVLAFSGECSRPVDDSVKAALLETGITVETVSGSIFTGRGASESIYKLARLEFILRLQSARPVKARIE